MIFGFETHRLNYTHTKRCVQTFVANLIALVYHKLKETAMCGVATLVTHLCLFAVAGAIPEFAPEST